MVYDYEKVRVENNKRVQSKMDALIKNGETYL